jgi:hypothetical protein
VYAVAVHPVMSLPGAVRARVRDFALLQSDLCGSKWEVSRYCWRVSGCPFYSLRWRQVPSRLFPMSRRCPALPARSCVCRIEAPMQVGQRQHAPASILRA